MVRCPTAWDDDGRRLAYSGLLLDNPELPYASFAAEHVLSVLCTSRIALPEASSLHVPLGVADTSLQLLKMFPWPPKDKLRLIATELSVEATGTALVEWASQYLQDPPAYEFDAPANTVAIADAGAQCLR